ncbi:MAG: PDZ domain-containing protein [Pyrinomonadaceae bacterium]|nr:PDZ domain-containing protein [Pyrinomonadaceae bacterium]
MTMRNLSLSFALAFLLSGGGSVLMAQQPPPPPSPPSPPPARAPNALAPPDAPPAISIFVDGGGFLGIYPENIGRENMSRYGLQGEPRGVGITKVVEGSPAERAGLRKDDVILRFDGEAINSARKLNRLMGETAPDHTVRLTILRGGSEQELSVTLGKRAELSRESAELAREYAEQLRPQVDELRRQGDVWRRQGDEMRRQMEEMRRNNPGMFTMSFGGGRRIGVSTTQLTEQLAEYFGVKGGRGVLITSVTDNGPAARAGLKAGDVVTEIDGSGIEAAGDLTRTINSKAEGDVTLTIIRDKNQRTVKVTPDRAATPLFDFSPEIHVAPKIGRMVIPRMELRLPPQNFRINFPRIEFRPAVKPAPMIFSFPL